MIQGCVAPGLLLDGKIIFVGGADQEVYGPGTQLVKTFDPVTQNWESQNSILDYRWYPTMIQMPDCKLLVIGGGGLDNPVRVKLLKFMIRQITQRFKLMMLKLGMKFLRLSFFTRVRL